MRVPLHHTSALFGFPGHLSREQLLSAARCQGSVGLVVPHSASKNRTTLAMHCSLPFYPWQRVGGAASILWVSKCLPPAVCFLQCALTFSSQSSVSGSPLLGEQRRGPGAPRDSPCAAGRVRRRGVPRFHCPLCFEDLARLWSLAVSHTVVEASVRRELHCFRSQAAGVGTAVWGVGAGSCD